MGNYSDLKFFARSALISALCFLLLSCGAGVSTTNMIPDGDPSIGKKINKSVRVLQGKGGVAKDFLSVDMAYVTDEQLREAVAAGLTNTRIFNKVTLIEESDLDLLPTVISQKLLPPGGGGTITSETIVNYTFTDRKTGKIVWRESILSEQTRTGGSEFGGAQRVYRATEYGVRENIRCFLMALAETDPAKFNVAGQP